MKKLLLLPLLAMLLPAALFAAVITGTVTNLSTNQPQANQVVWATDSTSTTSWTLSGTTNASGVYTITIPSTTPLNSFVHMYTSACGTSVFQYATYTGSSITANFNICAPTPPANMLHGTVYLGNSPSTTVAAGAKVYLIEKAMDSLTMAWMLFALDSTTTNASGQYTFNQQGPASSNVLVKAALPSGHASYSSYLPTYYTSSLVWSGATGLTSGNWTPAVNTNLYLQGGVNPGGPGFIGGSVLQGANKTAGVGDPLSRRILILKTAAGIPVAYTYSDAAGNFSFPNIAYGIYKLSGDAWGKANPELTVTTGSAAASVTDVIFQENSTQFKGSIGGLSVGGFAGMNAVALFPNPASDVIRLKGISGAVTLSLYNGYGALVQQARFANGSNASLNTSKLPAGIYSAEISSEAGVVRQKIVKQ